MRKIIAMFITLICVCVLGLAGCVESTLHAYTPAPAISTPTPISTLTPTNKTFISAASPQEPLYVLTISVKQKHYNLKIKDHLKDSMNEALFEIPVTEEYYNSVTEGSVLNDEFRTGSALTSGSLGSWNITIKEKNIITR